MAISLEQVHPPLPYFPPQYDVNVVRFMQLMSPYLLYGRSHISSVEGRHLERMVQAQYESDLGKIKCIYAFRHPTTDDHISLLHLFSKILPRTARQMGLKLKMPAHSFFVYDRGIPLWAGGVVNWLFPKLGGIPVLRGKPDRQAMKTMREHLVNSSLPLSIAPEGGTNGQSELVAELEPGVAQLAFWVAEDLAKAGRPEQVVIVPIGVQYEYNQSSWQYFDHLLMSLERDCGLQKPKPSPSDRYSRLYDLGIFLVNWVAVHYQKFYPNYAVSLDASWDLPQKVQAVIDTILRVAESHFGIEGKGTTVDRCRRLEQAVWDQVFRADLDLSKISALELAFANQLAKEANASMWHMRIAESILPVTGTYVKQHPSPSRFAEMLLLIWRTMCRVKLIPFGSSPYVGKRKLILSAGEPIAISEQLPLYQSSRQQAKECVSQTTQQLKQALTDLIIPSAL